MMPDSQSTAVREVSWRRLLLGSGLLKDNSVATNVHAKSKPTVKGAGVYNQSAS